MRVSEVMTSPVVSVRRETTVKEAVQLLEAHAITAMPVLDERGALVGVLSEADVIQDSVMPDQRAHERPVRLGFDPRPTHVGDLMSHHVLTVPAHADLAEAAELMTSTVVKSLPVVDRGRVVGIISRRDIIHLLARRDEVIESEIDELFRTAGEDWVVDVQDGVVTVEGPVDDVERDFAQVLVGAVPGVVGMHIKSSRRRRGRSEGGRDEADTHTR